MTKNILYTFLVSTLLLWLSYSFTAAHLAMFVGVVFSFWGGLREPHRGWILAFLQVGILAGFYYLNQNTNWVKAANNDATTVAVHACMFITLVASLMGAFIKRV